MSTTAESLVLQTAAHLVEALVREAHKAERVGDLNCVGQHGVEGGPIRARQVQGRPADSCPPLRRLGGDPPPGGGGVAAFDHIKELARPDIDDRGVSLDRKA